ncbi:RNA 3'-terminal phosphate cyclase [Candidatus Woesearchaeota archaeon]|nr:RNA 3'-terminal phosphate cyclase [Candidatus Woesearchaeota archaeon]
MITIDGSYGEGGGQILRTALSLSALTQQPFTLENIRAKREKPGLKPQHLTAIKAVQKLCEATTEGAELGSQKLVFYPKQIHSKNIKIDIGTAGSTTLVLQALIPPALFADRSLTITVNGGTDVKMAPQSHYLENVFIPQIKKYSQNITFQLTKRGYYPAGRGEIILKIKPRFVIKEKTLQGIRAELSEALPIKLTEQGKLMMIRGVSHASTNLQEARVAERQAHSAQTELAKYHSCPISIRNEYATTLSTGSGIILWAVFAKNDDVDEKNPITIGADALGEKGAPAEKIGEIAAQKLQQNIQTGAALDTHLADMLIPFLPLVAGSIIKPAELTPHTLTNIYATEKFFGKCLQIDEKTKTVYSI